MAMGGRATRGVSPKGLVLEEAAVGRADRCRKSVRLGSRSDTYQIGKITIYCSEGALPTTTDHSVSAERSTVADYAPRVILDPNLPLLSLVAQDEWYRSNL